MKRGKIRFKNINSQGILMKKRGNKVVLKPFFIVSTLIFLLFIFSISFISAAITCDSGDVSSTCIISAPKTFGANEVFTAVNLNITQGAGITNLTARSSLTLVLSGNLSMLGNANITGGNISILTDSILINNSAFIQLTGLGYLLGAGPGTVSAGAWRYGTGGAGYGGTGGDASGYSNAWPRGSGYDGGASYGNYLAPLSFGSGAGTATYANCGSGSYYGAGGGAIKINATGTLQILGNIFSNGAAGSGDGSDNSCGGGSGGSIFLIANNFSGAGSIAANGGAPGSGNGARSGGGSGGRIAIYSNINNFTGAITAFGGTNTGYSDYGAAGTIFKKLNSDTYGDMIIDNANQDSYETTRLLSGFHTFRMLNITRYGDLEIENSSVELNLTSTIIYGASNPYTKLINNGNITFSPLLNITGWTFAYNPGSIIRNVANITIGFAGYLTTSDVFVNSFPTYRYINLNLDSLEILNGGTLNATNISITANNVTVYSGGILSVANWGYIIGTGPGAGGVGEWRYGGGGGGHGGTGGDGAGYANPWPKGAGYSGGASYGNYLAPIDFGSGGGTGAYSAASIGAAGSGGGAIKINATGTINIVGLLTANGANGAGDGSDYASGGGSGGSIYLITNNILGSGTITAKGGAPGPGNAGRAGGGSGGRIAIYYNTNSFTGAITAFGGTNTGYSDYGAAGTIFKKLNSDTYGDMIIDNANQDSYETTKLLSGIHTFKTLNLTRSGHLEIENSGTELNLTNLSTLVGVDGRAYTRITNNGNISFPPLLNITGWTLDHNPGSLLKNVVNVSIGASSYLTTNEIYSISHPTYYTLKLNLDSLEILNGGTLSATNISITANNVTVYTGGTITSASLGYIIGTGSGTGTTGAWRYGGGGAGYGGTGGDGAGYANAWPKGSGYSGGASYGNYLSPLELGSGGSTAATATCTSAAFYGSGGGAIKINATGTIQNLGTITANGATGGGDGGDNSCGGGSGGSIFLIANNISGSGSITANGGNQGSGNAGRAGSGSGGRIALYYDSNSFTGALTVFGGASSGYADYGAAGTIFKKLNSDTYGDMVIDNANQDSYETTRLLSGFHTFKTLNLTRSGHLEIENSGTELNLTNLSTLVGVDGRAYTRITNNGNISFPPLLNITGWTLDSNYGSLLRGIVNITVGASSYLTTNEIYSISYPSYYSLNITAQNLEILSGGTILAPNISLNIDNLTIYSGGTITANSLGYIIGTGPGTASGVGAYRTGAGGAGYGGTGGDAAGYQNVWPKGAGYSGGASYGNYLSPLELGSGGSTAATATCTSAAFYGSGGGAIKINATGTIQNLGTITANGAAGGGDGGDNSCGGGSGGSIFLIAKNISGSGSITANGGNQGPGNLARSGSGSGGRIALYSNLNYFSGAITAFGGVSSGYADYGAAGTIFKKLNSDTYGDLIIDNNNQDSYETTNLLLGFHTFKTLNLTRSGHLEIENSGAWLNLTNTSIFPADNRYFTRLTVNGNITFPNNLNITGWTLALNNGSNINNLINMTIGSGGILTHTDYLERLAPYRLDLTLANLFLQFDGRIYLNSIGYYTGTGTGAGTVGSSSNGAGGAGHGGRGGNGESGFAGGTSYDDYLMPLIPGAGGGGSSSASYPGGSGGGAVKINASGIIQVAGNITADAGAGSGDGSTLASGGGSGGSIYLIANNITGNGRITAYGGAGGNGGAGAYGGGGSGGRIFLSGVTNTLTGILSAAGGAAGGGAATAGGEGSIYSPSGILPSVNYVPPTYENNSGSNTFNLIINSTINYTEDKTLAALSFNINSTSYIVYDSRPKLWLGMNNLSSLGESDGRLADSATEENLAGAGRVYNILDKFQYSVFANEWAEKYIQTDKVAGKPYYDLYFNATAVAQGSGKIYKNVTDFSNNYNHLEIRYKNYLNGPQAIKLYFSPVASCGALSLNAGNETCSEDNIALDYNPGWHILDYAITNPVWLNSGLNIDQLRFDINGATSTGNFYIDYLAFYSDNVTFSAPDVVDGKYGKARAFNGNSTYLDIRDIDDTLDALTGDFSFHAWIKLNNYTGNQTIISKMNATDGYEIYTSNGYLTFGLKVANNLITAPLNTAQINDTNWHNVIITFSRAGNSVRYVDGSTLLGTTYGISANAGNQNNSVNLSIGRSTLNGNYFNGSLDEVYLFNRVLTAAEVNNLYYSNLYRQDQINWVYYRNATPFIGSEGLYNYTTLAMDGGNFVGSNQAFVTFDTHNPNGTLLYPNNLAYTNSGVINFTANISDNLGIKNATLTIANASNLSQIVNQTTITYGLSVVQTTVGVVVTLVDGVYNWFYQLFDFANNVFTTTSRNLTVDTIYPQVNVIYPQNINYNSEVTSINLTIVELNKNNCFFFNGTGNTTFDCNSNITSSLSTNQGTNQWIVYANDTAGNLNSTIINFYIDSIYPQINFTNPTLSTNTYRDSSEVLVNLTASDTNLQSFTLYFYNSTTKLGEINNYTQNTLYYNFSSLPEGTYYYNATAIDSLGNLNKTETRTLTLDSTYPAIGYFNGTAKDYSNLSQDFIFVNLTLVESNVANITFTLYDDSGLINKTVFYSYMNQFTWVNLGNENYSYQVNVTDKTNKNNNTDLRRITLDNTNPNITSQNPHNDYYNPINETNFTINIEDNLGIKNASLYIDNILAYTTNFSVNTLTASISVTIGIVDGVYSWFWQIFDWAGNQFITNNNLTVSTGVPAMSFEEPTPENNSGQSESFLINVSFYGKYLANITYNWNGTNMVFSVPNESITSGDNITWYFVYNQTGLVPGRIYNYNLTAYDRALHQTFLSRTIKGNTVPGFIRISTSPNRNEDIDPDANIVFTVNISDIDRNLNITSNDLIVLQWKNSTAIDWTNISMINETEINSTNLYTIFNATLPAIDYEDTLSYRIFATDGVGESNISRVNNLSTYWDCTWNKTSSGLTGAQAYGYFTDKIIGNITIFNTGDIEYTRDNNCTLNFSIRYTGFSAEYSLLNTNEESWYSDLRNLQFELGRTLFLNASSNLTFNISASFPATRLAENPIITLVSGRNDSIYGKNNETVSVEMTISPPGPYLRQGFTDMPTSVYLTSEVQNSLLAYLENVAGNEEEINNAYNVSFNWSFGDYFTILAGNKSLTYENITNNTRLYQNLTFILDSSILESFSLSSFEVNITTMGYNSSGSLIVDAKNRTILNNSRTINFECYPNNDEVCVSACINLTANLVYDPDCELPGGTETIIVPGTGANGGGGGSAGNNKKTEKSEATFELVRGSQNEFQLEIKNKYDSEMRGINITVSGINSEYIIISPNSINSLGAKQSKNITVKINAPAYFTGKKYTLIFDITGKLVDNSTGKQTDLTDKKAVTLYIVEIPRVVAIELVDNATKFLEEMNASGMVLKDVNKLYDSINSSYANVEFGSLKDVYAQLALIYNNAFESKALIEELTKAINEAKTNGLTTTESYKLLLLGQTIYERGDYALALQRLNEAKLTYALETKGQYNLAYAIKNHPLESLGILLGLGLIGLGSGLLIRLQLLRRKLRMLNEEEVLLLELMKVIQKECFEKNHMSMEEYEAAMMQYENRLSQTVQDKIAVETKIANLLKIRGKRIALGEEKNRLVMMVKKVQDDYLNKGKIETRIYENMIKSYTARLTEVEEAIATLDAEAAVKKSKNKL